LNTAALIRESVLVDLAAGFTDTVCASRDPQRLTLSVAALVTFAKFAEMVTSVGLFGRLVETVTCALVAPAATVMLFGTAAIFG